MRLRAIMFMTSCSLSLVACPPPSDDDDDTSVTVQDAGTQADGAVGVDGATDAAVALDATVVLDAAVMPDGAVTEDAAAQTPDASVTPDATVVDFINPPDTEFTDEMCSNSTDDDTNGYADCDDNWCRESLAVTVCDALENTVAKCQDGLDNNESPRAGQSKLDGLTDCADPDCYKNPFIQVCPPLRWETGTAECGNQADDDGDGLTDCDDPDCLHAGSSSCSLGSKRRVLFDGAHHARAGSGDWVVDLTGQHPWPSDPTVETDWAGGLSSFGMALVKTGRFTVESLPANGALSFGDVAAVQDLMNYDVLVLPEPSSPFTPDEQDAVMEFIKHGGGVLMVTDHQGSDRDGNGCDSVKAFNDLLTRAGAGDVAANPLGFSVRPISYEEAGSIESRTGKVAQVVPEGAAAHPVMQGTHGTVQRLGMFRSGLFTLHSTATPGPTALMHALPLASTGYEQGSPVLVATTWMQGRVVAVGDSALFNDGTDSHGIRDANYDAWHAQDRDHATMFMNAMEWLAQ